MQPTSPPITVRPAVIADAEDIHHALRGIAETVDELHKFTSNADDIRRDGFGANAAFTTLVAEIGGKFAGISLFFPVFSTWRGQRGGFIQDLFVREEFRGMGVADELMRQTAAFVREQGGRYLALQVDRRNLRAQSFYRRLGMEISGDDLDCFAVGDVFNTLADAAESGDGG